MGTSALDIVIINWNSGLQLDKCLRSILGAVQNSFSLGNVVVVDNASSDGSADGTERFGSLVQVIHNRENLGFARACNQGAALGNAPCLLLLNPDTEVFENSLSVPLGFMESEMNKDVGICGIQLVDENGHVACTCAHFPSLARFAAQAIGLNKFPGLRGVGVPMAEWSHLSDNSVDQVIGAFFFTRRDVFEALNGFDERFFVYFEEVDFCFRAKQAGLETVYLTDAQAFHAGGGTSRQVKAIRLFYSLRSRLFYGFKHFAPLQAWLLVGMTMLVEPVARVVFCVIQGRWIGIGHTLRAYGMLWGSLPEVLRSRRERSK